MVDFNDLPRRYVPVARLTYVGGSPEERDDRARSMPSIQFEMQADLEKERIFKHFRPGGKLMKSLPMDPEYGLNQLIFHNLKNRWIGWGIWDDNWEVAAFFGHWMHEDIAPKGEPPHTSYQKSEWFRDTTNPGYRYTKKPTDPAILNKSRPINQFWSQIAHERLYLEETGFLDSDQTRTIDEQARENVRRRWIRQKMWSKEWQDVPGDTWDHESIKARSDLQWFYRKHPFQCGSIEDIAPSLPADDRMWFRRERDGKNWNFYLGRGPGPRIVPCNCISWEIRKAFWEQPCVPMSKLKIRREPQLFGPPPAPLEKVALQMLTSWNKQPNNEVPNRLQLEQDNKIEDSLKLEQKSKEIWRSSRLKQNDELKQKNKEVRRSSRLKQNDDEPQGSLHIKYNNGELRRSLRLIQKREQLANPPMISKSVAKGNRAERGKKVNATKRKAKIKQSLH